MVKTPCSLFPAGEQLPTGARNHGRGAPRGSLSTVAVIPVFSPPVPALSPSQANSCTKGRNSRTEEKRRGPRDCGMGHI